MLSNGNRMFLEVFFGFGMDRVFLGFRFKIVENVGCITWEL